MYDIRPENLFKGRRWIRCSPELVHVLAPGAELARELTRELGYSRGPTENLWWIPIPINRYLPLCEYLIVCSTPPPPAIDRGATLSTFFFHRRFVALIRVPRILVKPEPERGGAALAKRLVFLFRRQWNVRSGGNGGWQCMKRACRQVFCDGLPFCDAQQVALLERSIQS